MNLQDIITRTQRSFGDDSGAQITVADITRWANDAQLDIVRKTECLESHRETNAIASDGSYTLPPDLMFLKRVTFNGTRLQQTSTQALDGQTSGLDLASSATPTQFYLWGNVLKLFPSPSVGGSGNLDIFYIKTPVTLVGVNDTPEIPIRMHEDIVRYCLARANELDEDTASAQRMMADYDARMAQSLFEQKSQAVDTYPSIRLTPGDDERYGVTGW